MSFFTRLVRLFEKQGKSKEALEEFIDAAHHGDTRRVQDLLDAKGVNINGSCGKVGWTALHLSSFNGHGDVVMCLLNANASVTKTSSELRATALHKAVQAGHLHIVKMLVKASANLEAKTKHDETALMLATSRQKNEVAHYLIESNADTTCLQRTKRINTWPTVSVPIPKVRSGSLEPQHQTLGSLLSETSHRPPDFLVDILYETGLMKYCQQFVDRGIKTISALISIDDVFLKQMRLSDLQATLFLQTVKVRYKAYHDEYTIQAPGPLEEMSESEEEEEKSYVHHAPGIGLSCKTEMPKEQFPESKTSQEHTIRIPQEPTSSTGTPIFITPLTPRTAYGDSHLKDSVNLKNVSPADAAAAAVILPVYSMSQYLESEAVGIFDELSVSEVNYVESHKKVGIIPEHELSHFREYTEGNYGIVWRAKYEGVEVAVKMPKGKPGHGESSEIRTLLALPHCPNVLSIIGICTMKDPEKPLAVVTPFHKHGSLQHFSCDRGILSETDCINLVLGMARGVAHLHRHNVIHRDIALNNFLVNSEGRVLLADFGLSRAVETGQVYSEKDCMRWRWCAMETLRGQNTSAKSDMWSFGVAVWELLHPNKTPFDIVENPPELIRYFQNLTPALADVLETGSHSCVVEVIKQCCQIDESKRLCADGVIEFLLCRDKTV